MLAETQRQTMLATMGIDVYLVRERGGIADAAKPAAADLTDATAIDLVVACAHAVTAERLTARLRTALPLALGASATRIRWIETDPDGTLAAPPKARAYLALGAELPRALGEHLSTMQQMSTVIAVADAPQACLRDGLAKRALWEALKPIARHLRKVAG
jgi:hypothetical protein